MFISLVRVFIELFFYLLLTFESFLYSGCINLIRYVFCKYFLLLYLGMTHFLLILWLIAHASFVEEK